MCAQVSRGHLCSPLRERYVARGLSACQTLQKLADIHQTTAYGDAYRAISLGLIQFTQLRGYAAGDLLVLFHSMIQPFELPLGQAKNGSRSCPCHFAFRVAALRSLIFLVANPWR
jgi:hypothetical protein